MCCGCLCLNILLCGVLPCSLVYTEDQQSPLQLIQDPNLDIMDKDNVNLRVVMVHTLSSPPGVMDQLDAPDTAGVRVEGRGTANLTLVPVQGIQTLHVHFVNSLKNLTFMTDQQNCM